MQLEHLDDSGRQEINANVEGVILRELTLEDAQDYFDLIDADRAHFQIVGEPTADNYKRLEQVQASFANPSARKRFSIRHGGQMVGSINYEPVGEHTVEVGYWVGGAHTGNHYAGKALRTLTPYLLFELGWEEVLARARIDNIASRRTLVYGCFLYQYYIDTKNYAHYKAFKSSYPQRDIY